MNKTDKITDMGLAERLTVVEGQDGEFPVEWTDPSEADLEWAWDDMHFPQALTTLSGDYMTEVLVEGMNYRYERAHLPVHSYCRAFNGYIYFADKLSIPEDRLAAVRSSSKEKRQQSARELRDYWDNKVLPSLRASYEWMRDAPIETASLPDVADAWKRMWREAQHIWGLHAVEADLGPIDIYIANSGGPPAGDPLEFTREQWEAAQRTLLISPMTASLPALYLELR